MLVAAQCTQPACKLIAYSAEEHDHLYDVLRERKPISPAVAVQLGKLFGDGAGVWVRMQAAYDTWHAEREEDASGIPTLHPRGAKLERCSGTLQRRQALAVIGAPRVSAVALS